MTLPSVLLELLYILSLISALSPQNNSWIRNEWKIHSYIRRNAEPIHLTGQEKKLYVQLHNKYRRKLSLPAANMQYMEWDANLARIAQEWADTCIWDHGKLIDSSVEGRMGQNLYKGYTRDPHRAMQLWFDEFVFYDFHKNTCEPGKQCGHYTQVIWANSRFVGCALKIGCNGPKSYYIACNYYPAGNIVGEQPYKVGEPCTKCRSDDGNLCSDKLCVTQNQCSRYSLKCDCDLNCYNCGTVNKQKCKCQCKDGWDGVDCSIPCLDKTEKCWQQMCSLNAENEYHPCRKSCGICRAVNQSNLLNSCCDGEICPEGFVLNLVRPCSCDILCPGPKCSIDATSLFRPNSIVVFALIIISTMRPFILC